jgi:CheY-like chemotaxis protein
MRSEEEKTAGNLKVLVVDDSYPIRAVLGEMLKIYSREIFFADNGKEAVSLFESNPDTDLIFMDVFMHNMDGFEATRKIRQLNANVIIFVMTATALSELVEDFSGVVINDYFPKPFNKEYLHLLIMKYFKNKN